MDLAKASIHMSIHMAIDMFMRMSIHMSKHMCIYRTSSVPVMDLAPEGRIFAHGGNLTFPRMETWIAQVWV